jgi:hypothetical protein
MSEDAGQRFAERKANLTNLVKALSWATLMELDKLPLPEKPVDVRPELREAITKLENCMLSIRAVELRELLCFAHGSAVGALASMDRRMKGREAGKNASQGEN